MTEGEYNELRERFGWLGGAWPLIRSWHSDLTEIDPALFETRISAAILAGDLTTRSQSFFWLQMGCHGDSLLMERWAATAH